VPVLVGEFKPIRGDGVDQGAINDVVKALQPIVDDRTLIVVCSDLTRYGAAHNFTPFRDNVLTHIGELDMEAIRLIEALDYKGFMGYLAKTKNPVSGGMCIAIMMRLLPRDTHGILMSYDVSGRTTGNLNASVSFASLAFVNGAGSAPGPLAVSSAPPSAAGSPGAPAPDKGTTEKNAGEVRHGDAEQKVPQ
jgi:AmmeMemoRadiSam system protein B